MSKPIDATGHPAGPLTTHRQVGRPGHCFQAQVYDRDGNSLAEVWPTDPATDADATAFFLSLAARAPHICEHPDCPGRQALEAVRRVQKARAAIACEPWCKSHRSFAPYCNCGAKRLWEAIGDLDVHFGGTE